MVTKELRALACMMRAPVNKCKKRGHGRRRSEVGAIQGGQAMVAFFCRHLRGHIQYYGVSGNTRGVASYVYFASRLLFKWFNRRSQRRSMNWKRFGSAIRPLLPAARIVHDLYPIP